MNSGTSLLYPKFSKLSEFKAAQWCRQPIQFDYRILSFCGIFTGAALLSHVIVDNGILEIGISMNWIVSQAGFLLRIWWCNQSGNHGENNLAQFGYLWK
jgi:hypothetical protein